MEEKKKLKKLSLNKEMIVNLNDYEMNSMKGGTTWYCAVTTVVLATVYDATKSNFWTCPKTEPEPYISDHRVWINGEHVCQISEVYVYGLK